MHLGKRIHAKNTVNILFSALHKTYGLIWTDGKCIFLTSNESVDTTTGDTYIADTAKLGQFESVKSLHWFLNSDLLAVNHGHVISIWQIRKDDSGRIVCQQLRKIAAHVIDQGCIWNPVKDLLALVSQSGTSFYGDHLSATDNRTCYHGDNLPNTKCRNGSACWTLDGQRFITSFDVGKFMIYHWTSIENPSDFTSCVISIASLSNLSVCSMLAIATTHDQADAVFDTSAETEQTTPTPEEDAATDDEDAEEEEETEEEDDEDEFFDSVSMHNTSSSKRLSQALSDDNLVIVERGDVQFTLVVGAELPLAACVLSSLCDGDFQTPDITVTTSGGATSGGDTSLQMLECRDPQPHPLFNLQNKATDSAYVYCLNFLKNNIEVKRKIAIPKLIKPSLLSLNTSSGSVLVGSQNSPLLYCFHTDDFCMQHLKTLGPKHRPIGIERDHHDSFRVAVVNSLDDSASVDNCLPPSVDRANACHHQVELIIRDYSGIQDEKVSTLTSDPDTTDLAALPVLDVSGSQQDEQDDIIIPLRIDEDSIPDIFDISGKQEAKRYLIEECSQNDSAFDLSIVSQDSQMSEVSIDNIEGELSDLILIARDQEQYIEELKLRVSELQCIVEV